MSEKVTHVSTGEKLSNRNLFAFAGGGIGRDMSYSLWNSFLLVCIMYTKNVNSKQLGIIMGLMIACRIWDAVNDPIMGGIIERTRTKFGKFKPWILIGAVTNALVLFTVFAVPLQGKAFVIFFPFAYLLWDITFTMNDIGYWAMLPSLSSNDTDRNKLATWANILAGIGSGIAGIIIPVFTTGKWAIGNSAVTGFTVIAAVIGLTLIGCQTMTVCCVKEKPLPPDNGEKVGVKAMFMVIFNNKQLLWIAVVMIFYNLGSSLYFASTTNFLYFRFGYQGANAAIFGTLGGTLGGVSIFYPLFAKRFTRKTISIFGIATAVVGYVLMFVIGSATMTVGSTTGIFIGLILCAALITMGQTMFYMVQTISIANTIEYNEWKTGRRDEGIIFAVRPFMAKMGSALVVLFQLIIYSVLGVGNITNGISNLENSATQVIAKKSIEAAAEDYAALTNAAGTTFAAAEQSLIAGDKAHAFADVIGELKAMGIDNTLKAVQNDTKIWMLFGLTVIPAIFVVVALVIWCKKFTLDEKRYAEIVTENEARKAAIAEENAADGEAAVDETPEPIISEPLTEETAASDAFEDANGKE